MIMTFLDFGARSRCLIWIIIKILTFLSGNTTYILPHLYHIDLIFDSVNNGIDEAKYMSYYPQGKSILFKYSLSCDEV